MTGMGRVARLGTLQRAWCPVEHPATTIPVGTPVAMNIDGTVRPGQEGDEVVGYVIGVTCVHCGETEYDHANGKCLFDAGSFSAQPITAPAQVFVQQYPKITRNPYVMTGGKPVVQFTRPWEVIE